MNIILWLMIKHYLIEYLIRLLIYIMIYFINKKK